MFYLNENYRNSKAVTKYCIDETGYNKVSIEVNDGVVKSLNGNQHSVKEVIDSFIEDSNVRKVIIVKDINKGLKFS